MPTWSQIFHLLPCDEDSCLSATLALPTSQSHLETEDRHCLSHSRRLLSTSPPLHAVSHATSFTRHQRNALLPWRVAPHELECLCEDQGLAVRGQLLLLKLVLISRMA